MLGLPTAVPAASAPASYIQTDETRAARALGLAGRLARLLWRLGHLFVLRRVYSPRLTFLLNITCIR